MRIRVIYTAYSPAERSAKTSPRSGFEATALKSVCESPRLTIIVPPMQRRTLISFNHVNFSPKNTRETKNVKRLDALLKMVFDCKQDEGGSNYTQRIRNVQRLEARCALQSSKMLTVTVVYFNDKLKVS